MNLIWFLLVGAAAGWLAGLVMKGRGFGVVGNVGVGVVGAMLCASLFGYLGVATGSGLFWALFSAFVGSVCLVFVVGRIRMA